VRKSELIALIRETRVIMQPEHQRKVAYNGTRYLVVPMEEGDMAKFLWAAETLLSIKTTVDRATKRRPSG